MKALSPISEKMLGEILVERKVVSPVLLQAALDRQQKGNGQYKYIGEILREMGVAQEKINQALDASGKRRQLGEILVDLGILGHEDLQRALDKQKKLARMGIRRPLGRILVEMGYTNFETLLTALSKHFNMAMVSLKGFYPSAALQKAVGDAYAMKNKIVVLENDFHKIRLALAEPSPWVMDELRRTFPPGKQVEFCLANPLELDHCLRHKFDPFLTSFYR